jgi:hypothetical protein
MRLSGTTSRRALLDQDKDRGNISIAPDENLIIRRTNAQSLTIQTATTTKSTVSGTNTETITGLIPANSIVLGVTARVLTILAGASLTTWSLGITSHTDHYGTTLAVAAGTTVTPANHKVADIPGPHYAVAATDVLFTAAAGVFTTGLVRVTVWYITLGAETS